MALASTPSHGIVGVRPCSPARVLPNPPAVVRRVFSSPCATSSLSNAGTPCTTSSPLLTTSFSQATRSVATAPQLLSSPSRHSQSYTPVRSRGTSADVQPSRLLEGSESALGSSSLRASSSTASGTAVVRRFSPRRTSGAIDAAAVLYESGPVGTALSPRVMRTVSAASSSVLHSSRSDKVAWQDLPTMPALPLRRGSSLCVPPSTSLDTAELQGVRRGSSLCAPPNTTRCLDSNVVRRASSLNTVPNVQLSGGGSTSAHLHTASPQLPPNIKVLSGTVVPVTGSTEQLSAPQAIECEPSTGLSTETNVTEITTLPIGAWTFNMAEALQQQSRRATVEVINVTSDSVVPDPSPSFGLTSPGALPPTPVFASADYAGSACDVMSARVKEAATSFDSAYCDQDLRYAPDTEEADASLEELPPPIPLMASEATLPAALAAEQDSDAMSGSSIEVLPGTTDGSQGAYICDVGIVGAELGPLFDIRAFQSAVTFTNFYQSNAEVVSEKPHRFVVHTKEDLADNFVQVVLQPRPESSVTLELEAFFPLSHVVEKAGYGQAHTITLCLLPRGSGATPAAIFRHCARVPDEPESGSSSMAKIMLTCAVQEKTGSLWRSDAELEGLASDQWISATSCRDPVEHSCDFQARQLPQQLPPVPAAMSPVNAEEPENQGEDLELVSEQPRQQDWAPEQQPRQQDWAPEQPHFEIDTPRSHSQLGHQPASSPATDGWDDDQEQMWLHEELKRARNELRMQQTLMNFQERRLQVFEATSNAVAAANTASQAYDASIYQAVDPDPSVLGGVQDQIRHLGDQVQNQQEEISRLRAQLSFHQPGFGFPGQQHQQPILQEEQRYQQRRPYLPEAQEQVPQRPRHAQHTPYHREGLEQALLQSQERMMHEVEAREHRIAELERQLKERDQQLDMIPDAVESILRQPPPLYVMDAPAHRSHLVPGDFRTTLERSPVKPWEALPRQNELNFKSAEVEQYSRLSQYSHSPNAYDGFGLPPTIERPPYIQGTFGSLPPAPQAKDVSTYGDAPSTDRSQQDCLVRPYQQRATIADNSSGHHPPWESLLQDNMVQTSRRSTHLKGNVVNEYRLPSEPSTTKRLIDASGSHKSDLLADDFGITPCPTSASLAPPSCHFLGEDSVDLHRPTLPVGEVNFADVSAFPNQAAMTNGHVSANSSARSADGNVSMYSSLKPALPSGSHPEGRSNQHVTFHDSVSLPQDEHFFKRRTTSPVSAALPESERRPTVMTRSAASDAVTLGEYANLSPEVGIEMLQYTPQDPTDMLDVILGQCITYLQIPKTALGDASIIRESSGIYRLGPYKLRLKQLDGGIYMQQGPQEQQREFGDWLLDEARRNMQQLTRSGPQASSGGTSNAFAESDWDLDSKVRPPRVSCDTTSSSVTLASRQSPRNAETLFSHRSGTDSPASAKRSLNFLQSPEAPFSKCTNIELDIQIDIAADSTGTTGTTVDYQGPPSPTTASTIDGSARSEYDR